MRVLIMDSGSYKTFGGSVKDAYDLYKYLKENTSFNVDMLGDFSKLDKSISVLTAKQVFNTIKYTNIASKKFDYQLILASMLGDFSILNSNFIKIKYDVILMNSRKDVPIVDLYIRKNKGVKVIYVDRASIIITHKSSGIMRLSPSNIGSGYILRRMRKWLNVYITINAQQTKEAQHFFDKKTRIVYTGIAPQKTYRRLKLKKIYKGAIFVGRLEEKQKRLTFMINGIKEIVNRYPELKTHLLLKIIGNGPDAEEYKKLVNKLGIQKNISFEGLVMGEALVEMFNNAGFLVSTSAWEGLSRTVLEAMACGLPVLINDRINSIICYKPLQTLVKDGYNGFVYEYGSIEDFKKKFYEMYSNEKKLDKISINAENFLRKNFDIQDILKRTTNEIKRL